MWTFRDVVKELGSLDTLLEQQPVPSSAIIPKGRNVVQIDGEVCAWSPLAANQIRQKLGISENLEKNLPEEFLETLWQARMEYETRQPSNARCLPPLLKVSVHDGQVVGFADASLVTLSNTQIIEAIGEVIDKYSTHGAEATLAGDTKPAAWHLTLIFPSECVEPREGDIVQGGLTIKHSAAGLHGTQVRNYLHRLVCGNGSVAPICIDSKQLRIRRRREDEFADQHVIDKLRLVVDQGMREVKTKLEAVAGLAKEKVNAVETLNQIALKHRVRKKVTDRLLSALHEDEAGPVSGSEATMYDVWNAITRVTTHNPGDLLRESVRERLSLFSGVYSQQAIHTCPVCKRILEPSKN